MKHRVAFAAALALALSATAQYNETNNLFYHAFRTPQSADLNPAFFPNKNTVYLRLPSVGLQFGSPLAISDIAYVDPKGHVDENGDTSAATVIDINRMLNALTNDNRIRFNGDINLFGFGFKVHHTFIHFNTKLVNSTSIGLPVSIVNAVRQGNVDENGNPIGNVTLVDGDLFNSQTYLEIGIGAGHYFEPINLTVGARAKLLYGILNAQTDNSRAELITEDDFERMKVNIYYEVQTASAVAIDTSTSTILQSIKELPHLGTANTGLSFDIGARYDFGPFSFSLAVNDLTAGIHWRKNINRIVPESGPISLEFEGADVSTMISGGQINTDSIVQVYKDLLAGLRPDSSTLGTDYWYSVPTKINLGASYSFAKFFRAGLLLHGQFDRGLMSKKNAMQLDLGDNVRNTFRFNTTASVGVNLFNWMELMAGSSIVYDGSKMSFFNPGVGLVLTPFTAIQLYVMGDYVSSIYLTDAKAFNLKFGFNMLFGKGGSSKIAQN